MAYETRCHRFRGCASASAASVLARNAAHLDLLCLALNLRRVDVLTR